MPLVDLGEKKKKKTITSFPDKIQSNPSSLTCVHIEMKSD